MLRPRRLAFYLTALIIGSVAAAGPDPWVASYDPATQTRFIPVELWTGAPWNGGRELRSAPADLVFGERGKSASPGRSPGPAPARENNCKSTSATTAVRRRPQAWHDMSCIYSPGRGLVSVDGDE